MLYLSSQSTDTSQFRTKIENRDWEFVILSCSSSHLHLVIIEWHGDGVAARVGVLFIHPSRHRKYSLCYPDLRNEFVISLEVSN
jgi:hypothetical protein